MKQNKTKDLVLIALFAALTAICSQISVPLPFTPVPINLATAAVMLSGLMLKGLKGAFSQLVFIVLGAIGLPVFSAFSGGLGWLLGPTGGYIFGYFFMALSIGLILSKKDTKPIIIVAMVVGTLVCYILGSIWFMYLTQNNLASTLMLCVVPFLIGDIVKIIVCFLIYLKLRVYVKNNQ